MDHEQFEKNILKIKETGIGLVFCGYEGLRYQKSSKHFDHYIFLTSRDPNTDLIDEALKKVDCIDYKTGLTVEKELVFFNERDFKDLDRKEFIYTQRKYTGFTNTVNFDAGGCACCTIPSKEYWSEMHERFEKRKEI